MKVWFSHLSLSERRKIERWRQMKLSPDEMARRLGRHRSTIFRELRRNHFHDSEIPKLSGYWCVVAQSYSDKRRTRQRKLVRDPGLALAERETIGEHERGQGREIGHQADAHEDGTAVLGKGTDSLEKHDHRKHEEWLLDELSPADHAAPPAGPGPAS